MTSNSREMGSKQQPHEQSVSDRVIRHLRDAQALTHLIGDAPNFAKVIARLSDLARTDHTVLISGETGTGKELVARAIHYLSERAPFPFVALNCGLLGDALLEDELFGHERGAFTDARERRQGLLAQGEKGSLFLDEIDTLSPRAQVALLRVLQDRTFRAVGASCERRADVRFLAATNASLRQLVSAQCFRADLFYRLCVFCVELPALRDRKGDILGLAAHFLNKHTPQSYAPRPLSSAAAAALVASDWPGNVRELENAIIRAIHTSETDEIQVEDFDLQPPRQVVQSIATGIDSFKVQKQRAMDSFEREYLTELMRANQGNVSRAARAARKERRDFGRLLKKHGLDARRFTTAPPAAGGDHGAPPGGAPSPQS